MKAYESAEYLLQRGAAIDAQSEDGLTPLMGACQKGDLKMVELLLSKKANINIFPKESQMNGLHHACSFGHLEIAERLLREGADVNASANGLTPLHFASAYGDIPLMEFLLRHGANKEALNDQGLTPLALAIVYGQIPAQAKLLRSGADIKNALSHGGVLLKFIEQHEPSLKLGGFHVMADNEAQELATNLFTEINEQSLPDLSHHYDLVSQQIVDRHLEAVLKPGKNAAKNRKKKLKKLAAKGVEDNNINEPSEKLEGSLLLDDAAPAMPVKKEKPILAASEIPQKKRITKNT